MKKIILILLFISSLFASDYKVDKKYSNIKFEANKFLFVGVDGRFSDFDGSITVDSDSTIKQITGTVNVNSIDTKDVERDEHLKANDYFNIELFPRITFKSKKIIDNKVFADINIKGIQKELIFKIENSKLSENTLSFRLSSKVNRQDFMLNGSMSTVIADNVNIIANIVAIKK